MGVALLRSTSILPIVTLPAYSVASSSTMGAIARQGPHQAAQKSSRTGVSDFRTSWSKFASLTSIIPLPAILPPTPKADEFRYRYRNTKYLMLWSRRGRKRQPSALSRQLNPLSPDVTLSPLAGEEPLAGSTDAASDSRFLDGMAVSE